MEKKTLNLIIIVAYFLVISCSQGNLDKITVTREMMDTYVTITVYSDKDPLDAIAKAYSEIEIIEDKFSNFKEGNPVDILNQEGYLKTQDDEFIYLIEESIKYSILTKGAFDITVQPILENYSRSFSELKKPPTECDIKETLKKVGSHFIIVEDEKIILSKKDAKITLGGIAKGYAIDRAIEVLKENGIEHALVNAGGDMRSIGLKKGTEKWTIALNNPDDPLDYLELFNINNKAIATSGNYERYFDPLKKYHHIIDPRTGYSSQDIISVTIITDKAVRADALATGVYVLGVTDGLELIEKLDNVEGLIVTEEKIIYKSSGLK
jgi:FAD:protein FMN transferase